MKDNFSVDEMQDIIDGGLSMDSQINVLLEVLKNVLDEGAVRARTVKFKLQKYLKSKKINERVYALNMIASDGRGKVQSVPEAEKVQEALEDTYEWVSEELARRYIQKQNYYTLLQNCICKSVETLDTKSIYKAFVKNGLMDRLQWKLTTKKLLELQK